MRVRRLLSTHVLGLCSGSGSDSGSSIFQRKPEESTLLPPMALLLRTYPYPLEDLPQGIQTLVPPTGSCTLMGDFQRPSWSLLLWARGTRADVPG